MKLIDQIEKVIWQEFKSYKNVKNYITKWHVSSDSSNFNDRGENFYIYEDRQGNINLNKTLHNMDGEILLKIAIDLGIETPNFIPAVVAIKNVLKDNYSTDLYPI